MGEMKKALTHHTQTKESETMQGMVRRGDGGDYGSEQWGYRVLNNLNTNENI